MSIDLDALLQQIPDRLPLHVSEDRLNALLQQALARQDRIASVSLALDTDQLVLNARLRLMGAMLNYTLRLALEEATLTPTRRIITFRRLQADQIHADDLRSLPIAWFVRGILCGLCGMDFTATALKSIVWLHITRERISADLDQLGMVDKVQAALQEKSRALVEAHIERLSAGSLTGMAMKLVVEPMAPVLTSKLCELAMQNLRLENIHVSQAQGLSGDLVLARSAPSL